MPALFIATSFDQLLDSSESLPSSLDEKKQKNALVRKNSLDFLSRCVTVSGTYGTRGELTRKSAEDLAKLACHKLNDSDATTRKAATDVLLALLHREEGPIVKATEEVASSLQTSNPRAYKSLKLASSGGTVARPQSAPVRASDKAGESKSIISSKSRPKNANKGAVASAKSARPPSAPSTSDESSDEKSLPSFEDAVECLSALTIPKWNEDIDDGGILPGIQCKKFSLCIIMLSTLHFFFSNKLMSSHCYRLQHPIGRQE